LPDADSTSRARDALAHGGTRLATAFAPMLPASTGSGPRVVTIAMRPFRRTGVLPGKATANSRPHTSIRLASGINSASLVSASLAAVQRFLPPGLRQ
jgi:hypothetical protein